MHRILYSYVMTDLCVNTECSQHKSLKFLFIQKLHSVLSIHSTTTAWPVLVTHLLDMSGLAMYTWTYNIAYWTYLSFLHKVRGHDNDPTLPVMHHLPEVPTRALHGALSDDVSILELVSLSGGGKTEEMPHK